MYKNDEFSTIHPEDLSNLVTHLSSTSSPAIFKDLLEVLGYNKWLSLTVQFSQFSNLKVLAKKSIFSNVILSPFSDENP